MKSITIHGLDDALADRVARKARDEGASLNKTIKKLLAEALGLTPAPQSDRREDFLDLFGSWSDEDYEEFEIATRDFEEVDPRDWE